MPATEPTPAEDQMGPRVMEQTMDLFVRPEIERRKVAGRLPEGFTLHAAQVALNVDSPPQVRLNEEVKIAAKYRASGPTKKGEMFPIDPDRIVQLLLTDHDPNAAHITLFEMQPGNWILTFDFRYNAARARAHADLAREFLNVARYALDNGYLGSFVENLYGAAELMAKGILLSVPDKPFMMTGNHRLISARFTQWGKLGNVDTSYAQLLERLWGHRGPARYLRGGNFKLPAEDAHAMLETAEKMFVTLQRQIPERIPLEA